MNSCETVCCWCSPEHPFPWVMRFWNLQKVCGHSWPSLVLPQTESTKKNLIFCNGSGEPSCSSLYSTLDHLQDCYHKLHSIFWRGRWYRTISFMIQRKIFLLPFCLISKENTKKKDFTESQKFSKELAAVILSPNNFASLDDHSAWSRKSTCQLVKPYCESVQKT